MISSYLILAIAPLCWAGNIVLARGVIDIIPPITLAFWRWTGAFLLLIPFTWRTAKQDWGIVKQSWGIILLLSIFGISCFNTLLYTAVHTIPAINGALIQTAMPAAIILISVLVFKDRVTLLQIFGAVICMFGAFLVVCKGNILEIRYLSLATGDILMMIAVVTYALYSVLLRKRPLIHPLSLLTYTFGIGALGLLPLYIWEIYYYPPFEITIQVLLSILYVAVFPSIIAYFCWNRGIADLGPNRAGLFINLIPVFASVFAILFLNESLKIYHILGMVLIFSGMILFNRK